VIAIVGGPHVLVEGLGAAIADGDSMPSLSDGTDFATTLQNAAALTRTFTVRNTGAAALTLGTPGLPAGYSITEGLSATIPAGGSDTFTVQLSTAVVGAFAGDVSFVTNDGTQSPFNFRVTGSVAAQTATVTTTGLFSLVGSVFSLKQSNMTGPADMTFSYGPSNAGWTPLAGNWDGAGADTIGLYNPATSVFYLKNTNTSGFADTSFAYGPAAGGWIPLAGDWNGDGIDTIGLYNPSTSVFYLRNANSGGYADTSFAYGPAGGGWRPIVGDWDGNGTDTIGLYNPTTSSFYLRNSNTSGYADANFGYGPAGGGWTPVAGDWNGNAHDTIGMYNPASASFYLRNTNDTGYADNYFSYSPAITGAVPLIGVWSGTLLRAADGETAASSETPALGSADVQPLVDAAIARWAAAGMDPLTLARLKQVEFLVTDLPGDHLGEAYTDQVYLDRDAAGHGWFVDPTPAEDEEYDFSTANRRLQAISPQAVDRIDLLTVVEHELGHIAGLDDLDILAETVMSRTLEASVRRNAR
jgi:ribosomal protein S16